MTAREDNVIRNSIDGCKDVINLSLDYYSANAFVYREPPDLALWAEA